MSNVFIAFFFFQHEGYRLSSTLANHTSDVRAVDFSPDWSMLATGSIDDTAKIWNTATGIN